MPNTACGAAVPNDGYEGCQYQCQYCCTAYCAAALNDGYDSPFGSVRAAFFTSRPDPSKFTIRRPRWLFLCALALVAVGCREFLSSETSIGFKGGREFDKGEAACCSVFYFITIEQH